ncbi:MAG: hypothetical protein ACYTAS_04050, partial [Planctomycetota bacterium]
MIGRPLRLSRRRLVQVCVVALVCLPEVVCGQVGRKLVDVPVVVGQRGPRRAVSDSRPSEFDQYWPVIMLRQISGDRYEGRAELKVEPNAEKPLGCRITKTDAIAGTYSCNLSRVRSLRSGDTVTVSATLMGSDLGSAGDLWKEVEVATVFIDGGPWQAEVPVIMDGEPLEGDSVVTIKQTEMGQYGGCAEIRVGADATLPLSCKITALGLFSGKYSCSITTPEDLVPGQTVTVCAMLKEPGCRSQRPEAEDMKVAALSVEGGTWRTEIPVVVDSADWSNVATGNGSLVFVPNREALQLRLIQTGIHDYKACLDFEVLTRVGMKLACNLHATGALAAKYSCALVETDLEAPGGMATVCTKMREPDLRAWRSGMGRSGSRRVNWSLKGTQVATVSVYGMPAESDVSVEFVPSALSLADAEGSVTCHLELPEGYVPGDVDVSRVMLNEALLVQ